MSNLFEIFTAIGCYHSDWFSFCFIYDCQVIAVLLKCLIVRIPFSQLLDNKDLLFELVLILFYVRLPGSSGYQPHYSSSEVLILHIFPQLLGIRSDSLANLVQGENDVFESKKDSVCKSCKCVSLESLLQEKVFHIDLHLTVGA